MRTVFQDLRYALRVLARNPAFAAVALLTLALGIGANTAIFSLVDAILLRPLPYPDPEQLVGLGQWRNQKGEGYTQTGVSAPNVADITKTGVFQYVGYFRWSGFNITEGTRPESVRGIKTSADLLPMFGVPPLLGRFLQPEEMEAGHDHVAVIGHSLWQTHYGSDPSILGKTITLDQRLYTIVGVMPSSFRFTWDQEMDVFVPLVLSAEERSETGRGTSRDLQTQARIKSGLTIPQAQAAMNTLADNLARQYPAANQGWGIKVEPLHDAYHREMQTPLLIMLGAVLFVLLIACANVANLLLARATARKREIAIRLSLGATRPRLITQLLTESLLLAFSGGILGLLLASAGDRLLTLAMARYDFSLPNARIIDIDWRVLMFTLAITVSTGALFGARRATDTSHIVLFWVYHYCIAGGDFMSALTRRRTGVLFVGLLGFALIETAQAGLIVPGTDYFETIPLTRFDFGPGIGFVHFKGNPIQGGADTFVERQAAATVSPGGMSAPIPMQIVGVNLKQSDEPVIVNGIPFNVFVSLDPTKQSKGTLTILLNQDGTGGTYDTAFSVFFTVGSSIPSFSVTHNDILRGFNTPWSVTAPRGAFLVAGPKSDLNANFHTDLGSMEYDFYPGVPPGPQIDITQALVVEEIGDNSQAHHGHRILASAVPEPSGMTLVGSAVLFLVLRSLARRRWPDRL
jgi:hypothetical protein